MHKSLPADTQIPIAFCISLVFCFEAVNVQMFMSLAILQVVAPPPPPRGAART